MVTDPMLVGARCGLGVAIAGSGALQLATGELVRLGANAPAAWPAIAYATGAVLVAAGCALIAGRRTALAAGVAIALLAAALLASQLPWALDSPSTGHRWTKPLKSVALAGGLWLVAAPGGERAWTVARAALAMFLVAAGLQHFWYAEFVAMLVPAWMPARSAWVYITGAALLAGGAGMAIPRLARAAAGASAAMIALWVPMLHIPRAVTGPNHVNEAAGVLEALAFSAVALAIAVHHLRVSPARADRTRG